MIFQTTTSVVRYHYVAKIANLELFSKRQLVDAREKGFALREFDRSHKEW